MKSAFFIWKNPDIQGQKDNWLALSGSDFTTFIKSPLSHNRFFIKLSSCLEDRSDKTIFIEATKDEYLAWRIQNNHRAYLKKITKGLSVISLEELVNEEGLAWEDFMTDEAVNVEDEAIHNVQILSLLNVLPELSTEERLLIDALYLSDSPISGREFSKLSGIPQKTISNRVIKVLKKIKLLMAQS